MSTIDFAPILDFLAKLPATSSDYIGRGGDDRGWWVKFQLNTHHPLAWRTVQELGYVLNYLSLDERLPTVFMPVSPPPYLNGGEEFLSWVIEADATKISPAECAEWLADRFPDPVDDATAWVIDPEED